MSIERKVCEHSELKILTADESPDAPYGKLVGFASTYGNWDRVGERPVRGAFKNLDEFKRDGFIALDHDWRKRVAMIDVAEEREGGIWIEAPFHSTADAQTERTKAMERIARGKSVSLSIGYDVLEDEKTPEGRLLKDIRLYEVSLVSVPANPLALVADVKGGNLADGSLASMAYAEELDAVADAVDAVLRRSQARADLRSKSGRRLSAATRAKIGDLISGLQALLEEADQAITEATGEPKSAAEWLTLQKMRTDKLLAQYERLTRS